MKQFILSLLFTTLLYGSLHDKSAIFYDGNDFSYSMVGIHDYIVTNEKNLNIYSHGFKIYKKNIYLKVQLFDNTLKLFEKLERLVNKGYMNFFIDANTYEESSFILGMKKFSSSHREIKILLKAKESILDQLHSYIKAIVVENALNKNLDKIQNYGIDILDIEYSSLNEKDKIKAIIKKAKAKNLIPYVTSHLKTYGISTKSAIKREILTLIDESEDDRMTIGAHQYGALPLEYQGYIQKLYDVSKHGLPSVDYVDHYAGVIIWLNKEYKSALEIVNFVKMLQKKDIKVVFINNFGAEVDGYLLNSLGIDSEESTSNSKKITYRDKMIGLEIEPSLSNEYSTFLEPDSSSEPLLVIEDSDGLESIPIAIMPWGGYAMREACITILNDENLWVVDPFAFFKKALHLKKLIVPDPTTENGNRLFFTHVDGDGIMNVVESNPELYSGDVLLEEILKKFKFPHSISVIGAEIRPDGLYPKLSKRLSQIARDMYKLDNVESATHTFTHPFKWGRIINDNLPLEYRLKVKDYDFSLYREIKQSLDEINKELIVKKGRPKAKTVFWTGDCTPRFNALNHIYKNNILNINGGDTTISNANPWLARVAPLGLERDGYYQIFTGAQNENVYTNDWLGPFWGFKKVVQTFKLTNSPRRLKPIDVYYHIYSASKTASLNALRYVFKWVMKQDVMPIYTSAYIPKAMDYFIVSLAKENNEWLVEGMKNLKTLRIEKKDVGVDLKNSKTILGIKSFENHTYIALDNKQKHFIKIPKKVNNTNDSYLISANAKVVEFHKGIASQRIKFDGEVDLVLHFHLAKGCRVSSLPKPLYAKQKDKEIILKYKNTHKATVTLQCN